METPTKCNVCLNILSSEKKKEFWSKFDQNRLWNKKDIVFYILHMRRKFKYLI